MTRDPAGWWSAAARRTTVAGTVLAGASAAMAIGNALTVPRLHRPGAGRPGEQVVVCVPARDEATTLPGLLADLRNQTYPGDLRVLVLDDGSTDGTLAAARRAAAADPRVTVESTTASPPPGWTGKAAACRHLAERAFAEHPAADVIVFVDADVRLAPDAIGAAVAALRRHDAALLCPWPEQHTGTVAEQLVQPLLGFSWMATVPVVAANRSLRGSLAVACGQFLMFDAAAYRAIGGHEAVAASATEDLDIARALRRTGRRTVLVSGAGFVSCRMYRGWAELRRGYTRWLWSSFGGRAGAAGVLAVTAAAFLVPPAAAVLGTGRTRRLGAAGYLAGVTARIGAALIETARGTGGAGGFARRAAGAPAHPISAAVFAGLVVDSHRRRASGALSWKSRPLLVPALGTAEKMDRTEEGASRCRC